MQLCGSRGQRRTGACCRGWGSSTGQPTTHNIQVCAGLLKAWGEQVAEWPDLQLLGTYWPGTADRGNRLRHAQVKSESAFKVVSERSSQAPGKQLLMAGKRVNCWHTRGKYVAAYWYAHNAAGTPEECAAVAAYAVEVGSQLRPPPPSLSVPAVRSAIGSYSSSSTSTYAFLYTLMLCTRAHAAGLLPGRTAHAFPDNPLLRRVHPAVPIPWPMPMPLSRHNSNIVVLHAQGDNLVSAVAAGCPRCCWASCSRTPPGRTAPLGSCRTAAAHALG